MSDIDKEVCLALIRAGYRKLLEEIANDEERLLSPFEGRETGEVDNQLLGLLMEAESLYSQVSQVNIHNPR